MTLEELNKNYPLPKGVAWVLSNGKRCVVIEGKLPQDRFVWNYAWAYKEEEEEEEEEEGRYVIWAANPDEGGSPGKKRHTAATEQEAIDSMYTYFILGDWRNEIRD